MSLEPFLWTLRQRILDGGGPIAMSADRSTFIAGRHIYERVGSSWVLQAEIPVPDDAIVTSQLDFGAATAISADGRTVLIGAPHEGYDIDADVTDYIGAAWVFIREDDEWVQHGLKLQPNDAAEPRDDEPLHIFPIPNGDGKETRHTDFGVSVALSADGRSTAIVGGPGDAPYHENKTVGAAWVFVYDGGWTQQGEKIMPVDPGGWELGDPQQGNGSCVAVSADGEAIFIGTPGDGQGIYEYRREGETWLPHSDIRFDVPALETEVLGEHFAISNDATVLVSGGNVTGASYDEHPNEHRVRVFRRNTPDFAEWDGLSVPVTLVGTDQIDGDVVQFSVAITADGSQIAVGSYNDHDFEGETSEEGDGEGAAWVFAYSGGGWEQQGGKLFPEYPVDSQPEPDVDTPYKNKFGTFVGIINNNLIGGAPGGIEESSMYSYAPGLAVSFDGIRIPLN